jgi:hypothetical protein
MTSMRENCVRRGGHGNDDMNLMLFLANIFAEQSWRPLINTLNQLVENLTCRSNPRAHRASRLGLRLEHFTLSCIDITRSLRDG